MKLFSNLEKKHYYLLAGWIFINIIQAFFTNLHDDEAYYWLYSKQLDWGFFDHPPMTALLIYLGDLFLHNEVGIRLFPILLSSITMAMIMNELNEQKDLFFLSLFILSFPLVHTHIGGFVAIPDTPLVFFSLLFFMGYKKFIQYPDFRIALFLGFVAAAMVYSKYHAIVLLGLVVLSNLNLLKSKYFWTAIAFALILLAPHIFWQFENQFPTFRYHLVDRANPFEFFNVHNNITSQLLVAGPLTCLIVFYSLRKFKTNNEPYNRAVIFSILGFYILFFVMSFRNRIEGHWTTLITPLLMIATYPIISNNPNLKKWFKRLSLPIIVLFFLFRFYLAADFLPNVGMAKISFYKHQETTSQIKKMAEGKTVASFNNFAFIGTYIYYTGDDAIPMATPGYRYCQFDLWDYEEKVEGKPLFVVMPGGLDTTLQKIPIESGRTINTSISPKFQSLKHLKLECNSKVQNSSNLTLGITLVNEFKHSIHLEHPSAPSVGFMQNGKESETTPLTKLIAKKLLEAGEIISFVYEIPLSEIDIKKPIVIYTHTIEKNRGQLISINPTEF